MTEPARELDADFYTPAELKQLLNIGRDHVYRLLESGEIRSIRIGNQYRVPKSEYQAWMQRALSKASTIPFTQSAPREGRGQRTGKFRR